MSTMRTLARAEWRGYCGHSILAPREPLPL